MMNDEHKIEHSIENGESSIEDRRWKIRNWSSRSSILNPQSSILKHAFCLLLPSAFIFSVPLLSGCDQFGALGGIIAHATPRHIDAAYKGMAGQTVIVMVWVDPGLKMDHPDLQLDIATGLQTKLIDIARDEKPDLLKGTIFPVMASTVIRSQDNHPEWENEALTTTAAKFDGTRLIYLEITDFTTHAGAPELFRGSLKGDLKVVEMKDGQAKLAYTEHDIEVTYPKDSPKDGLPIGTEATITEGTVDFFTTAVAKRFYPHDEERE